MAHKQQALREMALFAGAGGGILGGKLLGWECVCAVEWEPYPAAVLAARQNEGFLPPFPIWDDVQTDLYLHDGKEGIHLRAEAEMQAVRKGVPTARQVKPGEVLQLCLQQCVTTNTSSRSMRRLRNSIYAHPQWMGFVFAKVRNGIQAFTARSRSNDACSQKVGCRLLRHDSKILAGQDRQDAQFTWVLG